MAVLYRLYQNNNAESEYAGKWYARAVMTQVSDTSFLADRIQRNCTVKKSDVLAVLNELVEVMQDELQASHKVKLNGFGSFKIGLKTKPASTAKEFTVTENVQGMRVNFTPELSGGGKGQKSRKAFIEGCSVKETPKNDVTE